MCDERQTRFEVDVIQKWYVTLQAMIIELL